jgi:predicted nuclease of restriction endonuclease-like RecB superfamily
VLTKDLLRVSRAGGGYHPQFVDEDRADLAARVIGIYQGHVGEPRERLDAALTDLERDADDFKLVRGVAKLLDRETTVETRAAVEPRRARRAAFEAAQEVGVVTEDERQQALAAASDRVGASTVDVDDSLYADRESRQIIAGVDARWSPRQLIAQYNLSLAQTALFDATEVRVRSSDPKALVSTVKRLRLMYEIRRTEDGREVVVTGPTALFRASRRYGTRFARLLRTVATAEDWHLTATVDDRGTERQLHLQTGDVTVPGVDPVTEVTYDSGVEADFAVRFQSLDTDWRLRREPEPLAAGEHVVIPDFAFEYDHADFTVFFEIMGFWTPEYVSKKLDRLAALEDVEMVVAVDESLGVGEQVAAQDHRVVTYSDGVRIKDVRQVLRRYESDLAARAADELSDELVPDADVVTLADLADDHGVSEDALAEKSFPDHERVGRTLVRPPVLDALAERIHAGDDLDAVETVLAEYDIDDASAVLSRLGYRVEWTGLSGGTVVER